MALVYFDSSALVKLVVQEDGTDLASTLWDGCDAALSSRLAHPEVCAALASAHRNRDLDAQAFASVRGDWEQFWEAVRPVELTAGVEKAAGELAVRRGLRGADAVHLASALAIGDPDLIVAVWDRQLRSAVMAEGLRVAPDQLR